MTETELKELEALQLKLIELAFEFWLEEREMTKEEKQV